jgi:hypothetical protein
VPEAVDYFSTSQKLHVSFSGSSRSWSVLNTRAKLDVSLNSLSITGRSAHYKAVANLAMWVQRHVKDYKIYFSKTRKSDQKQSRSKKVIQKDYKAAGIQNFKFNLEGHFGTFQYK